MSYRGVGEYYEYGSGMGSYFTFSPHEVYAGYGNNGVGSYYEIPFGSVAPDFNANAVWADVQLGGSCYMPNNPNYQNEAMYGKCNAAGERATNMIRAALNELGYGPLAVGNEMWSNANPGAAWKRFLSDHNLPPGPGPGVSLQGLLLMEKLLKEGKKPGPGDKTEFEKVNGTFIPKTDDKIAGMSAGTLLIAAAVVGGIGYLAYRSGKKKKGRGTTSMMVRR